ncbi:MAG: hypothetical protein LYZ70_06185 [Nitrososphaerales archaeon]|nr:hypothetical protein [Nitrososphaerales archaeon]
MPREALPSALKYARILVLIELTRFAGLYLFSGIQSGLLQPTAGLFAVGDGLAGLTAIPVWYLLGKPGTRRYGLAMAWVTFGVVDLVYALIDGVLSGQLGAISTLFGAGIVLVPINVVVQLVTLGLLLSKSASAYMSTSRTT